MINKIVCVLKTGGDFLPIHVQRLQAMVDAHTNVPYEFICLTDNPEDIPGVKCISLLHRWPGWWSKIELFRTFTSGRILYLDLDTIVCGSLDALITGMNPEEFYMLQAFRRVNGYASGVMLWEGNWRFIYSSFGDKPKNWFQESRERGRNDQNYIAGSLRARGSEPKTVQDLIPGIVFSYKRQLLEFGRMPESASIICFHGKPRPWDVDKDYIREAYELDTLSVRSS